jgi:hypothetical protein
VQDGDLVANGYRMTGLACLYCGRQLSAHTLNAAR